MINADVDPEKLPRILSFWTGPTAKGFVTIAAGVQGTDYGPTIFEARADRYAEQQENRTADVSTI
ncbi:MAG: hypothetical protein ACLSBB_14240 [Ruthenibacterium lactatiformans]